MDRVPATESPEPACFATRFAATDRRCQRCPHAANCAEVGAWWTDRLSIAQAEDVRDDAADPDEDPVKVVARVFKAYFRRAPNFLSRDDIARIPLLAATLSDRGISFHTWVCAQCDGLAHVTALIRNGTMSLGCLRGEGAERRYRYYMERQDRRRVTAPGELLRLAYLDGVTDLNAMPEIVHLPKLARAVIKAPNAPNHRIILLRSVCDFLGWLRPGVDQRIAMPASWDWTAFLAFVTVHTPPATFAETPPPSKIGGVSFE